ncbi:MAG: aminoglycoside adenylyltransferase domain-containing protein [Propionibacteriaceae bacterium]
MHPSDKHSMADPEELLARLAADLVEILGSGLVSLTPHGSWALGDFSPSRSDLDVLAVMATDPTAATVAALHEVHARLATDVPEWDGRVEVEYVSVEAIAAVVQGTGESHRMISVGGGEPFHVVEASRRYVLNWAAALQADRPVVGAAPSAVLPAIDRRLVHQVVLEHVRAYRVWLDDTQHPRPGDQAYTVLTLCRAAEALATGSQLSKMRAAQVGKSRFPEWSALIDWAREWWYDSGSDLDPGRVEEVRGFVDDVSARLLQHHDIVPNTSRDAPEPTL